MYFNKMRVLVIDDEDLIFQILKSFFEHFCCSCEWLKPKNINEVLEALNKDYNLILCDYMMPDVTGWDIFQAIGDDLRKKLVIITGGYIDDEKEKLMKQSNVKIFYKPFNINQLYQEIKERQKGA